MEDVASIPIEVDNNQEHITLYDDFEEINWKDAQIA